MNAEGITLEEIARIGLLFLDGEDLKGVLLDQIGHTDYDFGRFNRLKRTLLQIERIAPALGLYAILWQPYPTNRLVGAPVVAGSSLPCEGCKRQYLHEELRQAMEKGLFSRRERSGGVGSLYAPVRDSNGEIAGALELLYGLEEPIDVSCNDMFVEQKEDGE